MAKVTVGQLNRRPVFTNYTYTTDAGGGLSRTILEEWEQWANIVDTSGSAFIAFSQQLQSSDIKVTVRFDRRITVATEMRYENNNYKCNSMDVITEGYKNYLEIRYSKTEQWPGS